MFTESTGPASLTALHLLLGSFRRHRAAGRGVLSPFVLPSFLLAIVPWVWPTPVGLLAGLAAHVAWLVVCERLAPAVRPALGTAAQRPPVSGTDAAGAVPRPPSGFIPVAVLAVLDEAPGIRTFRLARPPGFEFLPGQFVPVRVQIDGRPHVRCYSISSAPHVRGYFEISVRRQGLVSGTLHGTLRAGSTLTIGHPAGAFTYPAGDDRPLALIAGGIGITPLMSMAQHAAAADASRPVSLLYSVRGEADIAFRSSLQLLVERHPQVRVVVTLSEPAGGSRFHTGRIDADMVRQHVPAAVDTLFYLCGPEPMVQALREVLAGAGVPEGQVRFERFDLAVAAALVNEGGDHAPATGAGGTVQVTFETSRRTVTASRSRTLLETAEAGGLHIQTICRSGVCLSCRTRLKSGTADCQSDVLDPADRAAGFVLPCVTRPTSDCVLEA